MKCPLLLVQINDDTAALQRILRKNRLILFWQLNSTTEKLLINEVAVGLITSLDQSNPCALNSLIA